MFTKTIICATLLLASGLTAAQSKDPNLKAEKPNQRIEKKADVLLSDTDKNKASPGVDPTDRNRKYEEEKKQSETKAQAKAEEQAKLDKEKEQQK